MEWWLQPSCSLFSLCFFSLLRDFVEKVMKNVNYGYIKLAMSFVSSSSVK